MGSLSDEFRATLSSTLLGRSLTTCSRWSKHRRVMGPPIPGLYTTRFHPWCDGLLDSKAEYNVSMKSAQAGFTEVGINIALYTVDVLKKDVLYVLPTANNASDFSKTRFDTALSLSPYLRGVFTDVNNVGLKQAGCTSLYIRGSGGDSNLKSIPVGRLIFDELDEMNQTQIELALERLSGQFDKQIWFISTPTRPNHGVSLEYAKSTQEHFMFKCPGCNRFDELRWPDSVVIVGEDVNDPRTEESYYQCTMCQYKFYQEWMEHRHFEGTDYKPRMWQDEKIETLRKGFWKSTVEHPNMQFRGFHINQLYSYTVSAGEIVRAHFKGMGNEYALQEFYKSKLGQPFVGEKAQVTEQMIQECIRDYSMDSQLPYGPGNRMITLGIDQGKWNYWVAAEWFYPQFCLDLNAHAECKILAVGKFLDSEWDTMADRLMHQWQIRACVVDADPETNEARKFARRFPGFVWLCRYRAGKTGREMGIQDDQSYAPIATVDRTSWLDSALGRFHSARVELPRDIPTEFKTHVMNLVRVYEKDQHDNPIAKYANDGPDHFGHAFNYSEIALPFAASIVSNQDVARFL